MNTRRQFFHRMAGLAGFGLIAAIAKDALATEPPRAGRLSGFGPSNISRTEHVPMTAWKEIRPGVYQATVQIKTTGHWVVEMDSRNMARLAPA